MDKSDAREVINNALRPMRAALALNDWYVDFCFESMEGKVSAECVANPDYVRARFIFDHDKYDSVSDLLDSMLHEFMHVALSEYELYRKACRPLVNDEKAWASLDEVYVHACETTVHRLENMLLHGVNTTPRRLVSRGRRLLDEEE